MTGPARAYTFGLEAEIQELEKQLVFKKNCAGTARHQYHSVKMSPGPEMRDAQLSFLVATTIFETEVIVLHQVLKALRAKLEKLKADADRKEFGE